ncbi:Integrator complex subunit 6 [Smittium culicis]|uniref:Integrator complex subunit 6 n=1 Tax=Smittium culicis TaxID=133412 RepID=A0A1R1YB76_9FUNG|nr:Integrator complex subunit 6 [Smittium culicis]
MIIAFLIDTSWSMGRPLVETNPLYTDSKASNNSNSTNKEPTPNPNLPLLHNYRHRVNSNLNKNKKIEVPTRLDCAKSIVEQILQKQGYQANDSYLLVTYDENDSDCIKSKITDSPEELLMKLKDLKPQDTSNGGNSLSVLFHRLRLLRLVHDTDTIGQLNIPVNPTPWSDLYQEPFRWDQRLLTVFLHEPGDKDLCFKGSQSSEYLLSPMCSVMGGNSGIFHVGNMKQAQKFVESICPTKRIPNSKSTSGSGMLSVGGVVVNFEKLASSHSSSNKSENKVLIYAPDSNILTNSIVNNKNSMYISSTGSNMISNGSAGYFPIPESFWLDSIIGGPEGSTPNSFNRPAQPTILYSEQPIQWTVPPKFPFDKFQVDPSSKLSQNLIAATNSAYKSNPDGPPVCWPVYVANSYRANNAGFPFGLLRANTARTAVNLFLLPYNYPALFILLRRFESIPKIGTIQSWKLELDEYLTHTPTYYTIPLRRAFLLYGMPKGLIGDNCGNTNQVINFQKFSMDQRKLAKNDWDSILQRIKKETTSNPIIKNEPDIPLINIYDIPRNEIITSLSAMRKNFIESVILVSSKIDKNYSFLPKISLENDSNNKNSSPGSKDILPNKNSSYIDTELLSPEVKDALESGRDKHNLPVSIMGLYQQAMARKQAQEIRDPLMDDEMIKQSRKPMFGNPYRKIPKPAVQFPSPPPNGEQLQNLDPRKISPRGSTNLKDLSSKLINKGSSLSGQVIDESSNFNSINETILPSEPLILGDISASNGIPNKVIENQLPLSIESNSEIDGEAQINESSSIEQSNSKNLITQYTRFGWIQKRNVAPRYRALKGLWKPGDESWNINPWSDNKPVKRPKREKILEPVSKIDAKEPEQISEPSKRVLVEVQVQIPDINRDEFIKADNINSSEPISDQTDIIPDIDTDRRLFVDIISKENDEITSSFEPFRVTRAYNNLKKSSKDSPNQANSMNEQNCAKEIPEIENALQISTDPKTILGTQLDTNLDSKILNIAPKLLKNILPSPKRTRASSRAEVAVDAEILNDKLNQSIGKENLLKVEDGTEVIKSDPAPSSPVGRRKKKAALKPKKTPAQFKLYLIKQIKLDLEKYNEELVLENLELLNPEAVSYTKDQKKAIANACLLAAKPLRRRSVISRLESLLVKLNSL